MKPNRENQNNDEYWARIEAEIQKRIDRRHERGEHGISLTDLELLLFARQRRREQTGGES